MDRGAKRLTEIPCRRVLRPQERYLNLLTRVYETRRVHPLWAVPMILGLVVFFSSMVTYTYSYFTASESVGGNTISTAYIGDFLSVSPGKGKATFPAVGDPSGETRPVAAMADGELSLDFGEVTSDSEKNFVDVLSLRNISGRPLTVSWWMEGEIANVIPDNRGQFQLLPAGTNNAATTADVYGSVYSTMTEPGTFSLDFKLNAKESSGFFDGYLYVKVNEVSLSMRIPAKVQVREKNTKDAGANDREPGTSIPEMAPTAPETVDNTQEPDKDVDTTVVNQTEPAISQDR